MNTSITFGQMERSADRTLAVALWARHVSGLITCATWFAVLHIALRGLLRSLSTDGRLNTLTDTQAMELVGRLRELHSQLMYVLDHRGMQKLKSRPVFPRFINSLEDDTEDLYDIIENLTLSNNKEFRSLISDCVQHLSSVNNPEPVGHL
jgi:hypothetical protein